MGASASAEDEDEGRCSTACDQPHQELQTPEIDLFDHPSSPKDDDGKSLSFKSQLDLQATKMEAFRETHLPTTMKVTEFDKVRRYVDRSCCDPLQAVSFQVRDTGKAQEQALENWRHSPSLNLKMRRLGTDRDEVNLGECFVLLSTYVSIGN